MKIHTKLNDDLCGTLIGGTWVDYNLQTTIQVVSLENQTSQITEQTG
jgi:hypothetical protein